MFLNFNTWIKHSAQQQAFVFLWKLFSHAVESVRSINLQIRSLGEKMLKSDTPWPSAQNKWGCLESAWKTVSGTLHVNWRIHPPTNLNFFCLFSNPLRDWSPRPTPLSTQAYVLRGVRILRKDTIWHLFAFCIPAKQCISFIKSKPIPVCHPHGCAKHLASESEEAF